MLDALKRRFSSWSDFEEALKTLANATQTGDGLETLASFYLQYFRLTYQSEESVFPRVDKKPFPEGWKRELNLGDRDLGIDGIYRRTDDELVAVQVKFRSAQEKLTYSDLATFWSESEYAHLRMVFTNASDVTEVAQRRRGHLLVSKEQLVELDDDFWASFFEFCNSGKTVRPKHKLPRDYQESALVDIQFGFKNNSRGKLIAACGIGKTLIGLWAVERLQARSVLFMAPNLQLIRQTLNEWASQTSEPFVYLAVCSDQTVSSELDELSDALAGTDIPITTSPAEIARFLGLQTSSRKIIFSTYQSLQMVMAAQALSDSEPFDIGIFDEAHKTAGLDSDTGFGAGLSDSTIAIKKRLFMTATERLYSPRLQSAVSELDRKVFSMDNPELYGPIFHRLSFSKAIQAGIISDYRVVVAILAGSELRNLLAKSQRLIDTNSDSDNALDKSLVVNQVVLRKVFEETGVKKIVSYHRSVRDAKVFAQILNEDPRSDDSDIKGFSIDGGMASSKRAETIRNFELADSAVLSNARCLVEGVDIPVIDGVMFASPKNSLIDIVQAVGRALRKPYNSSEERLAAVVVPIILDPDTEEIDVSSSDFDRLYNVIQALRDQDEGIADQIDQLNLEVATGRSRSGRGLSKILHLIVPASVDVDQLESALELRIAEANGNTTGTLTSASRLGSGQRGSGRNRLLRTMGDYTPSKFESSLVRPTLDLFPDLEALLPPATIKINNNNVAHSQRLGVIKSLDTLSFELTSVGKKLKSREVEFNDVFRNQMLLFAEKAEGLRAIYPYRSFIDFMIQVEQVSYLDFLYGIYAVERQDDGELDIAGSIERVEKIRSLGLLTQVANEKSKKEIFEQLSSSSGVTLNFNDVWTDRTTTYNQFRYFRRHLELFENVFIDVNNVFKFREAGQQKAKELLATSGREVNFLDYGNSWWV